MSNGCPGKTTGERVQPKLKDRGPKAALCAAAVIIGSGLRSQAPALSEYAKDFYRWAPWAGGRHGSAQVASVTPPSRILATGGHRSKLLPEK
jgi:hypothetical protein